MKIIVGLGNPTSKYENTFHNLGFMAIDSLADKLGVSIKKKECDALTAVTSVKGETVVVAKPQTYMNLSGECVKQLVKKYKADPSDVFVAVDDLDITIGLLRIREKGSGGTHNGLRNIVAELDSKDFKRLKIGMKTVDIENRSIDIKDKVLSKIKGEEKKILDNAIEKASDALFQYINGETMDKIQQNLN